MKRADWTELRLSYTLVCVCICVHTCVCCSTDQQIRWLKVVSSAPRPLHTLTKTQVRQKLQPSCLHPHQWAQRAEKRQEGPCTKVQRAPGPLSSFVLKNGEVQEQLLLAARDIWDGPFHRKQSLEFWVCWGGGRGGMGGTLSDQRGADSLVILQISSSRGKWVGGVGGWGRIKWRRKPLKLTWVTSVTAQRSPGALPYGVGLIICSLKITERYPTRTHRRAGPAPCSTQRQHTAAFWLGVELLSFTLCLN